MTKARRKAKRRMHTPPQSAPPRADRAPVRRAPEKTVIQVRAERERRATLALDALNSTAGDPSHLDGFALHDYIHPGTHFSVGRDGAPVLKERVLKLFERTEANDQREEGAVRTWVTPREIAQLLECSQGSIQDQIVRGNLDAYRPAGRFYRIRLAEFRRYLHDQHYDDGHIAEIETALQNLLRKSSQVSQVDAPSQVSQLGTDSQVAETC